MVVDFLCRPRLLLQQASILFLFVSFFHFFFSPFTINYAEILGRLKQISIYISYIVAQDKIQRQTERLPWQEGGAYSNKDALVYHHGYIQLQPGIYNSILLSLLAAYSLYLFIFFGWPQVYLYTITFYEKDRYLMRLRYIQRYLYIYVTLLFFTFVFFVRLECSNMCL